MFQNRLGGPVQHWATGSIEPPQFYEKLMKIVSNWQQCIYKTAVSMFVSKLNDARSFIELNFVTSIYGN